MKKTYLLGGGIAVLTAAILAGCNGNDDDGTPTTPAAATTQSLTVTPSLGKILNAKVVARNAKTGIEIGTGNTGNTGIASFNVTKTADPHRCGGSTVSEVAGCIQGLRFGKQDHP